MRIQLCVLASLLLLPVAIHADDSNGNSDKNCPSGLNCADGRVYPHPQSLKYEGDSIALNQAGLAGPDPNPYLFTIFSHFGLTQEFGVWLPFANTFSTWMAVNLETPFYLRGNVLWAAAQWNALTYFTPSIGPAMYLPLSNPQFPFSSSRVVTEAFNTTVNRNTAVAYATLRIVEYLTPQYAPTAAGLVAAFGLNTSYTGTSDPTDPRDIGNIAALATIAYAKADGWNSEGSNYNIWKHPYIDQTKYIPTNDAFELKNVAQWQPLMETKDDGMFWIQQHVAPQAAALQEGWALNSTDLNVVYKVPNNQRLFKSAGSKTDKLSQSDLAKLKSESDIVLQASANLNDQTKMLTQLFDSKAALLGMLTIDNYLEGTYGLLKWLALDFGVHLAAYDSTVVSWKNKVLLNSVRPVSAIRYLYGNQNVTAYAGPYQGTQSISGSDWNSFLRTMPHAEFPSGTTCLCVASAEFLEKFANTPGYLNIRWNFAAKTSIREPGVTPAQGFTRFFGTTDEFNRVCADSRVNAGVHFKATVDYSLNFCKGIGYKVWDKFFPSMQAVL